MVHLLAIHADGETADHELHAEALTRALEARFPTAVFAAKVKRHLDSPAQRETSGHVQTATHVKNLSLFLEMVPEFDLVAGNIDRAFKDMDHTSMVQRS